MMENKAVVDAMTKRLIDLEAEIAEQNKGLSGPDPNPLAEKIRGLLRDRDAISAARQVKSETVGYQSLELTEKALSLSAFLEPLESDAVVAVRRDLGFDTTGPAFNWNAYKNLMAESSSRQHAAWGNFIGSFKHKKID